MEAVFFPLLKAHQVTPLMQLPNEDLWNGRQRLFVVYLLIDSDKGGI